MTDRHEHLDDTTDGVDTTGPAVAAGRPVADGAGRRGGAEVEGEYTDSDLPGEQPASHGEPDGTYVSGEGDGAHGHRAGEEGVYDGSEIPGEVEPAEEPAGSYTDSEPEIGDRR